MHTGSRHKIILACGRIYRYGISIELFVLLTASKNTFFHLPSVPVVNTRNDDIYSSNRRISRCKQ